MDFSVHLFQRTADLLAHPDERLADVVIRIDRRHCKQRKCAGDNPHRAGKRMHQRNELSDNLHDAPTHNQGGANSCGQGSNLEDGNLRGAVHLSEGINPLCGRLHNASERSIYQAQERNFKAFNRRFEDGHIALRIVENSGSHAARRALGIVDRIRKRLKFFIRRVYDCQQAGHTVFTGQHGGILRFFGIAKLRKAAAQRRKHLIQRNNAAGRIGQRNAELIHCGLNGVRGLRHIGQHISQRRTGLTAFDTAVCHQTDGDSGVLDGITQCASNRSDVFERFAHHADVRIGVGGRRRKGIAEHCSIIRGQTESGQSIGNNIGRGVQFFAGRSRQVHDRCKTGQHFIGFPTSHGHVFQRLTGFGCGKGGGTAHLNRLCREGFHLRGICA